jgi:hypothetical protein
MSLFDDLKQSKPKPKKPSILLYSKAGCGKTSLAAQFKNPLFLIGPQEDGIGDLQQAGLVSSSIQRLICEKWEQVSEYVDDLIENDHKFETLVLDAFSLGGFETLLFNYVGELHFEGNMTDTGFYSFQKGPHTSMPYLQTFLSKLDRLREKMTVIVLCHSKVGSFDDPERGKYGKIQLNCEQKTADLLIGWASNVGFIEFAVEVAVDKQTKKGRGKGGTDRELHFTQTAVYDAKNRWGLTDVIDLGESAEEGYKNWMADIAKARAERKAAPKTEPVTNG